MKVGIINYGMGNLASVQNALNFLNVESEIIDSIDQKNQFDKYILPGVGAFAQAIQNLKERNLIDVIRKTALVDHKPLLGLCLGMQLLFDKSVENGNNTGLQLIPGKVLSIKDQTENLVVPHMGWNELKIERAHSFLNEIPENENDVYFVHSYYCQAENYSDVLASCEYGVKMDVIVQKGNIYGCQFHPEKSQKIGLKLLQNFCEL
jgi:imidazole glycerol-phosphate synthase subunit HisH